MVRIEPFEKYSKEYDEWFIKNQNIYLAELNAIKRFVPFDKFGVEIGVGTGRFALPLGIKVGVDPSRKMAEISRKRGIQVYEGVAEQLPFKDKIFDYILMVTTICFLETGFDISKSIVFPSISVDMLDAARKPSIIAMMRSQKIWYNSRVRNPI